MIDLSSILEPDEAKEVQKIINIYSKKFNRRYNSFLNREELRAECLEKLAEYIVKGKHKKECFLRSYATAVKRHMISLLEKWYNRDKRQEEVNFSALETEETSSFIDLTQEYTEVESAFDLIVFKEQIEELKFMLTPLSVAILKQITDPDPAFHKLLVVHKLRKKHLNQVSGFTAYEKPKLVATLSEYFGESRSSVRECIREIQDSCHQIFPDWQVGLNFELDISR